MGMLLLTQSVWVFIGVVAAVIAVLIILAVFYFLVKNRVNENMYECKTNEEASEEPLQEETLAEIKEDNAEDSFKATEEQEPQTESKDGEKPVVEEEAAIEEPQIITGKSGETIEIRQEQDGYRFYIIGSSGKVLGASEPYKSKAGALKGLKSLAGYADAGISTDEKGQGPRFEVNKAENGFAYKLLSKSNAVKLSGDGFADEESCIEACRTVMGLSDLFEL